MGVGSGRWEIARIPHSLPPIPHSLLPAGDDLKHPQVCQQENEDRRQCDGSRHGERAARQPQFAFAGSFSRCERFRESPPAPARPGNIRRRGCH